MKYILDASIALRWGILGPHTAKALQLRDDYLNNFHELLAPDIYLAEVGSALTKAERQKLIPLGDAAPFYAKIAASSPAFHSYLSHAARALEISSQTRSGFYDCLYVALAESEGCEMVTADDKLIKNLQAKFKFIIHLTKAQ